uniref:Uncharacterized protein n=1 Tax=Glossina pallidipes TaxID=7398 RepID=A0A1A9Z0S5_GLOPL
MLGFDVYPSVQVEKERSFEIEFHSLRGFDKYRSKYCIILSIKDIIDSIQFNIFPFAINYRMIDFIVEESTGAKLTSPMILRPLHTLRQIVKAYQVTLVLSV